MDRAPATWNRILGAWALVGLAACSGGGGGGSARPTATPTPTATVIPTFTPSSSPTSEPSDTPTPQPTSTPPPTATPPPSHTPTEPAPTATAPTAFTPPANTPTATPLTGPIVSAFGVADASGTFNNSVDEDAQGRAVFVRAQPSEFIVYVEGRPGPSGLPVGTQLLNTKPTDPSRQPDLQIESERGLGNASSAVCDKGYPDSGGVAAISPPDFGETQTVSDGLNDFSCRFKDYSESDFACTQDSRGDFLFANSSSTTQFCVLINESLRFPIGDTLLSVRLRDTEGRAGAVAQIVVRIVPGGPVLTPTPGGISG